VSPRAAIEARVLVTDRMRPLAVRGRTVHQIGLPYHWGVGGHAVVEGDAANDLLGIALDPNVQIQESKVGSCDIRPGRRPRGPAVLEPGGRVPASGRAHARHLEGGLMGFWRNQLSGPDRPDRRRQLDAGGVPQGVLHRHLHLHRLQGL
jgi:hypothetical protein